MVTLTSRIPQVQAALTAQVRDAAKGAAGNIVEGARDRAPRDTGDLAEGYEARADGVYAIWRYHFTEFGTTDTAARPHLLPALEAELPQLQARLASIGRGL